MGSPRTNCFALWEKVGRVKHEIKLKTHPFRLPTGSNSGLPAKIAELEDSSVRVHKQILGLDVTVTHTLGVDVGQAPEELVHVHLGWVEHSTMLTHWLLPCWLSHGLNSIEFPNLNACHNHLEDFEARTQGPIPSLSLKLEDGMLTSGLAPT